MADKVTVEVSFRAGPKFYARGQEIPAGDPIVSKYPSMFKDQVRTTATVPTEPVSPPAELDPRPAGNASRDAWAEYVRALGGTVTDDLGRDDLRDLAADLEG